MKSKHWIVIVVCVAAIVAVYVSRVWESWVFDVEYTVENGSRMRSAIPAYAGLQWLGLSTKAYDVETGFMTHQSDGCRATWWDENGKLHFQASGGPLGLPGVGATRGEARINEKLFGGHVRMSAPWFWGETDQAEPKPPAWVYDDSLFQGNP